MRFDGYGKLEWLEPEQFWAGHWRIVGAEMGEDGERYDIVWDGEYEVRYSTV